MKISIDARFLTGKPTGIGDYCEKLLVHLSKLDKENEYLILVNPAVSARLKLDDNYTIQPIEYEPISYNTIFWLHRFLEKNKVTIFHSLFPLAPVFFKGTLIITVHDIQPFLSMLMLPEKEGFLKGISSVVYEWLYSRALKRADWIITVSKATRNYLVELFPFTKDKVIVIHSGIGAEWFKEIEEEAMTTFTKAHDLPERYLLYEGSCRPSKNIRNMLSAFKILYTQRQDFKNIVFILALYDDGYLEDVKDMIKDMRISERVRVLTSLRQEEIRILYKKAHIMLFITKYEGFGFPVLQSQAAGTPVVVSTSAALPEITRGSALTVEPDDPEEIAVGISRLLTDQSLYKELVKRGYENAKQYSWENTARRVLEIYRHIA